MRSLHTVNPPLRYGDIQNLTIQDLRGGSLQGHLLDTWVEDGYPTGLWINDGTAGNGQMFVIRCPENQYASRSEDETMYDARRRREQLAQRYPGQWYVDREHVIDHPRTNDIVWGLEPITDFNNVEQPLPPECQHYYHQCTGFCRNCGRYDVTQEMMHDWNNEGVCHRCGEYNEDMDEGDFDIHEHEWTEDGYCRCGAARGEY